MTKEMIDKLKDWVNKNYIPHRCSWTAERSMDNYYDCFSDGETYGTSWAAYEVGQILGMDLPEPEMPEDEEFYE